MTLLHDSADMRDWFPDYPMQAGWGNQPRLGDCPFCGHAKHLAIYANGIYCYRCGERRDIYTYLIDREGYSKREAYEFVTRHRTASPASPIRSFEPCLTEEVAAMLDRFAVTAHRALTPANRDWWHRRGASDEAIDAHELGYHDGWYTMRAITEHGMPFSVKRRWGDEENRPTPPHRYRTLPGSVNTLCPWTLVSRQPEREMHALIVPGEIKALAVWSLFDRLSLPWTVITTCGGENNWPLRWNKFVTAPFVAVWEDPDETGQLFYAQKVSASVVRAKLVSGTVAGQRMKVDDYILAGGDLVGDLRRLWKINT
jgi:hypothetical protein